jgi:NitT/TauT family transport system ATP-binding protein
METSSDAPLAIDAATLSIGYRQADGTSAPTLAGLDLKVAKGEFLTILGPSGCGKSTLLRVVADLLQPLDGRITVLGQAPTDARRQRRVGFVFQDATLLPWRTVRQNVELPLQVGRAGITAGSGSGRDVDAWIALVGLSAFADRYPHQLSGGQRQRVSLARALLSAPDILLMDEPFGALDEITRERLNDELLGLWRRTGTTILFVTHSVMEAVYLGSRVLVLAADPGRVQALVDLSAAKSAAAKDAEGRYRREDPALVEAAAQLRQLLQDAVTQDGAAAA